MPTYPAPAPSVDADVLSIHRFLKTPTLVAKRVRTLLMQRYIADAILKGRYKAVGGAILFDSGDPIGTGEAPRAVSAGGEYPLVSLGNGVLSTARTTKWGQDSLITDEAISRFGIDPVNRALGRLANQNVMHVDSVALGVVTSAVTTSSAAKNGWATADDIFADVLTSAGSINSSGDGFEADTVALPYMAWVKAIIAFAKSGYLPRESSPDNITLTGEFPNVGGLVWLPSPNAIAGTALVLDSEQLGGMADEELGGPGYVSAGGPGTAPVEVKTIRDDDNDQWKARARRVTVPVVVEPTAGRRITGVPA